MERLKMQTPNQSDINFEKLASLFPTCVTETVDTQGQTIRAIDAQKLAQEINSVVLEQNEERYQFTWPNKRNAVLAANAPINATLRPCREESVNFDTTQNLYIEGDNLDVLKCLKETYSGKVKMIYIDPPYNTGKDFVYKDNRALSANEYLANSGQYDEQGNRLVANTESNGRFHTDWLNMIYPRLKVARDLLSDDGVIFISIDDHEVDNLRKICDEIFGESNFINNFMWLHGKGKKDKFARTLQQYIIGYAKNKITLPEWNEESFTNYEFSNPDNDPKGKWFSGSLSFSESRSNPLHPNYYEITSPTGVVWKRQWQVTKVEMEKLIADGDISWGDPTTCDGVPRQKIRPTTIDRIPNNIFDTCGSTKNAENELEELLGAFVFDYPKPIALIEHLVKIAQLPSDSIIMDFFSGSATTAHAIMDLNAIDNQKYRYIMVQIAENLDDNLSKVSDAKSKNTIKNSIKYLDEIGKPHYLTEIGKERIRRAGKKILAEHPEAQGLDTGFRVLKLDSTNMQSVYYAPTEVKQDDLLSQAYNIKLDRTDEDLLFQVMLELGITLDSPIKELTIAGKHVYDVANGFLLACFDDSITDDAITKIAKDYQPTYFVLRDSGYVDDSTASTLSRYSKPIVQTQPLKHYNYEIPI